MENGHADLSEFEIIERFFAPLADKGKGLKTAKLENFALTDDAAVIASSAGKKLVVTSDSIVSGVHFFGDEPADLIAQKALRVNLSDLASKAATPLGYTLCLHVPNWVNENWLENFAAGLARDQEEFGCSLLGGDTVASPVLAIAITAIGQINGHYPARNQAKPGDDIYVTGCLGDSALGLRIRQGILQVEDKQISQYLTGRYHLPLPRLEMQNTIEKFVNASMDLSDGLLGDLKKLCKASGVSAQIFREKLPLSSAANKIMEQTPQASQWVIQGGDDYEIMFTASPEVRQSLAANCEDLPYGVCRIGCISKDDGLDTVVRVLDHNGQILPIENIGHEHRF